MGIFSTTTRYTGFSGIDVESMVSAAMQVEKLKYDKLLQQRDLLKLKQSAYTDVATKLKEFQSTYLNMMNMSTNLRSATSFIGMSVSAKVSGAETDAVKATATSSAKAGTYKLDVYQLAKAETWTSDGFSSKIEANVSDMNFSSLKAGDSIKISMDGASYKTLTFTQEDITKLQADPGNAASVLNEKLAAAFGTDSSGKQKVTASLSSDGGKLILEPLKGHSLSLANGNTRTQQVTGENAASFNAGHRSFTVKLGDKEETLFIDIPEGVSTSGLARRMNEALETAGLSGNLKVSVDSDGVMSFTASNTSEKLTLSGGLICDAMGATVASGESKSSYAIELGSTSVLGDFGLKANTKSTVNLDQKMSDILSKANSSRSSFSINGTTISFNANGTLQDFMNAINNADAGVKISYDDMYDRLVFEATETGAENAIILDSAAQSILENLGMTKKNDAMDAEFSINGDATLTRASNTFDMYGITVQLNDTTEEGKPVVITVEKDAAASMDLIKKFVDSYNTMIEELNSLYTTNRSKKTGSDYDYYMPLTDDEKANMTEKEIELWEAETNKGLLYREDIIGNLLRDMRSMLHESVNLDNGGKISLYEIGITTSSDYKDKGKLVIDEEKLKKALTERAEDVATLFTKSSDISATSNFKGRLKEEGLAERLNDLITSVAGANGSISKKAGISSADTSALLNKQISAMDTSISKLLESLEKKEENLYAKYAVMEAAITKANEQIAALQSTFGTY